MNVKVPLFLLLFPFAAFGQGFAGLGTTATDNFDVPELGTVFEFPTDHGQHETFRIEWWYLTATLTGEDGQDYGAQWTLFRSALEPKRTESWDSPQIWMGHAAITSANAHFHAERFGRDGSGQAGVTAVPFEAWIDDWSMMGAASVGEDALDEIELRARGGDWSYQLSLEATGPLVPQGQQGYSVKSEDGQSSYYYSQPFYQVSGSLELPSGTVQVTGQAWLDREWSSQPLSSDQTGWDWFSLHFATGEKMMGFQLRDREGESFTSGTWISVDGTPIALAPRALVVSPLGFADVEGREVPVSWRLRLPDYGLDITTTALNDQSWMPTLFPYWEGPIRFTGSHDGRGYLEMTGYEPAQN